MSIRGKYEFADRDLTGVDRDTVVLLFIDEEVDGPGPDRIHEVCDPACGDGMEMHPLDDRACKKIVQPALDQDRVSLQPTLH